ncbi:hypothetical protein TRVL_09336 [Trypanosoma vivax]|nr:hypothetical protein TRVL_09336 [Trypanosoma vivax]
MADKAICALVGEKGDFTCNIEKCEDMLNYTTTTTNVACACKESNVRPKSCTLKPTKGVNEEICSWTDVEQAISCKTEGNQNCTPINCTTAVSGDIAFQLKCECDKGEGAQNQGKKTEGAQNQGKPENEKPVQHENAGAQNSERPGEVPSSESSTGASSASEGNAKQSAQHEKKEEGVSAAARNSQEAAYLYPLFSFIAVMPRIN